MKQKILGESDQRMNPTLRNFENYKYYQGPFPSNAILMYLNIDSSFFRNVSYSN